MNSNCKTAENLLCMSSMQKQCQQILLQWSNCHIEFHMVSMPSLWQRFVLQLHLYIPTLHFFLSFFPPHYLQSCNVYLVTTFSGLSGNKCHSSLSACLIWYELISGKIKPLQKKLKGSIQLFLIDCLPLFCFKTLPPVA